MCIGKVRDIGLYIRDRRREFGMTQAHAAATAGVSQRWLASMEAGKDAADVGLILRTLHALRLTVAIEPAEYLAPDAIPLIS